MTNTETEFQPTEVWQLDEPLEPAIEQARQHMNQKDSRALIDQLQKQVQHSEKGVTYAVLRGKKPEEYSSSEALVMFNPFANAATPNMLVRAEFIREVARFADVRDEDGKLKPIVMLASPGLGGSKIKLSYEDKKKIVKGDLGPAAKELLHAISETDIGRVSLFGYSQGADTALAGAKAAYSANLDVESLSIGEPANVKDRGFPRLAYDFMRNPSLKPSIERTGLDAQKEAVGKGRYEGTRFQLSIAARPFNWLLGFGMASNSFERNIQEILINRGLEKVVVGYGSDSYVTPKVDIEQSLEKLDAADNLISVKIEGGNHTWGDQMTLLAKLYMRALD